MGELMATPETKDSQPAFLKVLPLMIGWFSLNVPSALCVYWVTNNVVTTATSVPPPPSPVFSPNTIRDRPAGFASGSSSAPNRDGVTPITSNSADAIDAEVVVSETIEVNDSAPTTTEPRRNKQRGSKKKRKRRKKLDA